MAHAYTPGLRVTRQATIRRERRLPLKGEVLVASGEEVRRDQVVARTELPGDVVSLNLVNQLGASPGELAGYMLKGNRSRRGSHWPKPSRSSSGSRRRSRRRSAARWRVSRA